MLSETVALLDAISLTPRRRARLTWVSEPLATVAGAGAGALPAAFELLAEDIERVRTLTAVGALGS